MIRGGDRIDLLGLFVRVAEARSLSDARRTLGLSQPSTSRQLKQLETLLGVQLVQRSTHDFALTGVGEQFLTVAANLLADWDAGTEATRLGQHGLQGSIKVATPVALGQTILARIAARFTVEHPAVAIDWRLVDEPGDLAADGYDLWIRAGPIRDQSLIVRDLWQIERTISAGKDASVVSDPLDLEPRHAVRLVTYVPLEVPLQNTDGQTKTLRLKPSFTTDNIYAAVIAGVGYGVLPFWAVRAELDAGSLIQICPDWRPPSVTLSVAYPQTRFRPARVTAFLDFLRAGLPRTGAGIFAIGKPEDSGPHVPK